jgi:hypothetical protein
VSLHQQRQRLLHQQLPLASNHNTDENDDDDDSDPFIVQTGQRLRVEDPAPLDLDAPLDREIADQLAMRRWMVMAKIFDPEMGKRMWSAHREAS